MSTLERSTFDVKVHRANLKRAYRLASVEQWSAQNLAQLFTACQREWGDDWQTQVQDDGN